MAGLDSNNSSSAGEMRKLVKQGSWMAEISGLKKSIIEISSNASNAPEETVSTRKAMILPHAGHCYSGTVCASGFKGIDVSKYSKIVMLGFSHQYIGRETLFVSGFDEFQINDEFSLRANIASRNELLAQKHVKLMDSGHDHAEHSLEIILPFLHEANPNCELLLVYVAHLGMDISKQTSKYFKSLYNDQETLFLISSDFCHYGHNFSFAFDDITNVYEISPRIESLDKLAIDHITDKNPDELYNYIVSTQNTICGVNPILFWLHIVDGDENIKAKLLSYDQSCRIVPDRCKSVDYFSSVSYAAICFYKNA